MPEKCSRYVGLRLSELVAHRESIFYSTIDVLVGMVALAFSIYSILLAWSLDISSPLRVPAMIVLAVVIALILRGTIKGKRELEEKLRETEECIELLMHTSLVHH